MGKTLLGGTQREEDISLLTPEQSSFLSSALGPQQQLASGAYSEFLQPYNQQAFGDLFQKSFIDPSLQALQRQIVPGLKEGFLGLEESGSGALNRALAQSATDVATGLGSQYMDFFRQQQASKLGALGQLGGLAGQRTFEPQIEQTQGILGPLIAALGKIGGGFAMGGPAGAGVGALSGALGSGTGITPGLSQRTGAIGGGGMAFGR